MSEQEVKREGDRVEIFIGDSGEWTFHRVAGNNEIISDGETYGHANDAKRSAVENYGTEIPYFINGGNDWQEISPAELVHSIETQQHAENDEAQRARRAEKE